MPLYRIRLINSEFESCDESTYPSQELATASAIAGATRIVSDSITDGTPAAAIEIQIHAGETMVARKVVTLSVADLSGSL